MKTRSKTMAEKTQEKIYLEKIRSLEAALSANNLEITGLKNEKKELQVTLKEKDAQIDLLSNEINEVKSQKETKPKTHTLASQTEIIRPVFKFMLYHKAFMLNHLLAGIA